MNAVECCQKLRSFSAANVPFLAVEGDCDGESSAPAIHHANTRQTDLMHHNQHATRIDNM